MTGELIPTGVTFGVGRNSINDSFSGTAYMNNIELDSGGNFSAGTGGGIISSGGTDLYNIFLTSAPNNTTASNGLTKSGDNITLGGEISGNTVISLSGLSTFILSGSANDIDQIRIETNFNPSNPARLIVGKASAQLYSESGVSTNNSYVNAGAADVVLGREIGGVAQQFYISESDGFLVNDNINNRGIDYGSNYHANYTNRTLVDKEYVINHSTTATTTGSTIRDLSNTYIYYISGDSANSEQIALESHYAAGNPSFLYIGRSAGRLGCTSGSTSNLNDFRTGTAFLMMRRRVSSNDQYISFQESGGDIMLVADNVNSKGLEYDSNYHSNYTNRSLVDYEYVNNHVASAVTSGGGVEAYVNIGNTGTSFTWNVSGDSSNYRVTLTGNTTLNLDGVRSGEYGTLIVSQDAVGGRTITLGTVNGAVAAHRVVNGGGGTITLTSTANAIDIMTFTFNSETMFWSVGNDYT